MIYKSGVGYDQLEDLIAGKTPTYAGWDNDPTDGADITDGDISTFCTTGDKVAGAGWAYAYFEWDLGALYDVICTGVGYAAVTAGDSFMFMYIWDGSAWIQSSSPLVSYTSSVCAMMNSGGRGSKIRMGLASSAAATITPNIREFHVWRL